MVSGAKSSGGAFASNCSRREYTLPQRVQRKIQDNFRGFSPQELDVTQVGSLTLRQRLSRDMENLESGKDTVVQGAHYYNELRKQYRSALGPGSDLKVKDASLVAAPALVRAVAAARRAHPDRTLISAFVSTVSTLNQSEMCGLARYMISLKCRCIRQHAVAMDCLRMCGRLHIDGLFPEEWASIKNWGDEVIEHTLVRHRSAKSSDTVFIEMHAVLLHLFMPVADLKKVSAHKGGSNEVSDELVRLVGSSQVGARLFAASIKEVLAEKVQQIINQEVYKSFHSKAHLDAAKIAKLQVNCMSLLDDLPCLDMLPPRRAVKFMYRGVQIIVNVSSAQEQVQLGFACALKGWAVQTDLLTPLWVESLLVPASTAKLDYTVKLDPTLLSAAGAARASLKQQITDSSSVTGDMVLLVLGRCSKELLLSDASFRIEVGMVEALCSDLDGSRVQAAILRCLPSAGEAPMQPETSLQQLRGLAASEGFKLVDRDAQGRLQAVQAWVGAIQGQRAPDLGEAASNPGMSQIVEALALFLLSPAVAGKTASRGRHAIEPLLAHAVAVAAKGEGKVEDVLVFTTFGWLLSPEQKEKAKTVTKEVQDKLSGSLEESLRKRARTKAKAKPASGSSAKAADADKAMAESLALFS